LIAFLICSELNTPQKAWAQIICSRPHLGASTGTGSPQGAGGVTDWRGDLCTIPVLLGRSPVTPLLHGPPRGRGCVCVCVCVVSFSSRQLSVGRDVCLGCGHSVSSAGRNKLLLSACPFSFVLPGFKGQTNALFSFAVSSSGTRMRGLAAWGLGLCSSMQCISNYFSARPTPADAPTCLLCGGPHLHP
jgi:hypothetical protein